MFNIKIYYKLNGKEEVKEFNMPTPNIQPVIDTLEHEGAEILNVVVTRN